MTELQQATELLSRLVATPSVNPNRRVPDGAPFGEGAMAQLLSKMVRGWGAKVCVQKVSKGRFNFIATFKGSDASRSLMLEAHSDTVAVDGMTIPPFQPTVKSGRLYGRGACDTKGPMAAMLLGIRAVLDKGGRPPVTVHFVSTCDEELGATGAHFLMKNGFCANFGIVGEPTDLKIVHAHKGALRLRIQTQGVAAHSASPERGVNAIYKMSALVDALENVVAPALQKIKHPLLGNPTLSVGTIRGGSQVNIVPAHCEIEMDRRLVPGESGREATRHIIGALQSLKKKDRRLKFSHAQVEYYPPLEQQPTSAGARLVENASRKILGKGTFTTAPWASNAGVFNAAGIPCVVFGPGSIAQAHTKDEFIELKQVVEASRVFAEVIRISGDSAV